ncbi:MAG: cell division protein FtsA [Rikenellaceae bacterium]|nr:cell division protein FtsA [Rikenellaceae bacterium]
METKDYVVAIDLGTSKVATLVGRRSSGNKIEVLGSSMSDSLAGVVRGEIKNTEHLSKALDQTLREIEESLGIQIREAWVGVSGQHIKTLKHSGYIFIENNEGEVRQRDVQRLNDSMNNIQIPVGETIIHILPQEYRLDDEADVREPVGMIGKKLEASFNIMVGDKSAVGRIDRTLSKHNISVKHHILNPLASAEAVLIPDEKELGVCVVDIGGGTTDICIYHDNIIRHTAVIPLGGNIINKDIRSYGILERRVESLKVKFGGAVGAIERADKFITIPGLNARDPKEISCRNLASIIEARLMDIIDSVKYEIKKAGYTDRLGAGIVLTGGTAQTNNIDVLFRNHTGYDVRVAIPDTYVTEGSLEMINSPVYSVAVGLLLKATGAGSTTATGRRPMVKTATVTTVKPPVQPQPETPRPESGPPVETPRSGRRVWNDPTQERAKGSFRDTSFDDSDEKAAAEEEPKKGGWLQRVKERLTSAFDVVDDEI